MFRNGYLPAALFALALSLAPSCGKKTATTDPPPQDSIGTGAAVRPVIYQMLVRHFSNTDTTRKTWGTLEENGVGKFNGVTDAALESLRALGVTHVWYTGVLEHATVTAFPEARIEADDADVVKGRLGSPYAIKDYYDVSPALAENPKARMAEFEALVKRTHAAGLKVIIDFVPNHVARSYHSDAKPEGVEDLGEGDDVTKAYDYLNNFYYLPGEAFVVPKYDPLGKEKAPGEDGKFAENPAKATGNNVFSAKPSVDDWFETVKLNYGVDMQAKPGDKAGHQDLKVMPPTWEKMTDILLFWSGKGVDGFRCDVAEMVPVDFWAHAIHQVKRKYPKTLFIAEIYTPSLYKDYVTMGGFDYLYDKVGLYDKVRPLMEGKPDAKVAGIAEALQQSEGIDHHMLRFLENHDEQRIASRDFAGDPKAGIPGMAVTALIGKGPVLIYCGQEVGEKGEGAEGFGGEDGRTTIFDYWGVPAHQAWVNGGKFDGGALTLAQQAIRTYYQWLLQTVNREKAITEGERFVIPVSDPRVYTFIRCAAGEGILVLANFNQTETAAVDVNIPEEAWKVMVGNATRSLFGFDNYRADFGKEGVSLLDQEMVEDGKPLQLQVPPLSVRIIALGGDV